MQPRLCRAGALVTMVMVALGVAGCGGSTGGDFDPPDPPYLDSLAMNPTTATVQVGASRSITVTGRDQYGDPCDCAPTWTVEGGVGTVDTSSASKAATHTVEFTATSAGSGAVIAQVGGMTARCALTVTEEAPPPSGDLTNLFFLHHSTGNGFVEEGDMRATVASYNAGNGTSFELWDHGYNGEGLRNAAGVWTGTSYNTPGDNTDPDGLHELWTTNNNARRDILANHEVIAFKSCFPASAIGDSQMLAQYKQYYREMRDFFDTRTDRLFVVMSTPPLHRLSTNTTEARNARAFANWLKSAEYLGGHPNVVCYDLFNRLAKADDGSAAANRLRYEYEGSHNDGDSHPNTAGNEVIGPSLAQYLIDAAQGYSPPGG